MGRGVATQPNTADASLSLANDVGELTLSGHLDAFTLPDIWARVIPQLRDASIRRLNVDASALTYCDGAGIGLLVEIDRIIRANAPAPDPDAASPVDFRGLPDELTRLLERALLKEPLPRPPRPLSTVDHVGNATAGLFRDLAAIISFLGEVVASFAWAIFHPRRIRWHDVFLIAEKAGANAVPVVCLLGWLVGVIISFQSAAPLHRFGAQATIPTLLSISLVRELGPLFTAIILAGRSGSAFAAEIGTMKVTEEINALSTFGLDPVRFLVIPRLLAAIVMTPLLGVLCTLAGLIGGYVVMAMLGFSLGFYINQVRASIDYIDVLQGFFKCAVFAFLVCGIGCLRGLRTGAGPGAVGDSTTRAVVAGIILVVAADGILGVVFYFAGI